MTKTGSIIICLTIGTFLVTIIQGTQQGDIQCSSGEEKIDGPFRFMCNDGNFVLASCVASDRDKKTLHVAPGATHNDGHFIWQCSNSPMTVSFNPIACVHNNTRIEAGGKYVDKQFVIKCKIDATGAEQKPVGCLGDDHNQVGPNEILVIDGYRMKCVINGPKISIEPVDNTLTDDPEIQI